MNKIFKRIMATICALTLVVGCVSAITYASSEHDNTQREWVLYSGEKEFTTNASNGKISVYVDKANVTLPDILKKADLMLSVTFNINDAGAVDAFQSATVELAQEKADYAELYWTINNQNLKVGDNTIQLKLSDAGQQSINNSDAFVVNNTINWFRIYTGASANGGSATLKEVKLIDCRVAGLEFGGDGNTRDTYLQLTDSLNEVPKTIEASVKMDAEKNSWLLGNKETLYPNGGTGIGTYTTVATDTPGEGLTCMTMTGDNVPNSSVAVNIDISEYKTEKEKLAVTFWCYSEQQGTMATRFLMRLASGTNGISTNFLRFNLGTISLEQGWNYVVVPLQENIQDDNFSWEKITYFGFDGTQKFGTNVRRFTDFQLVVIESASDWTLGSQASLYPNVTAGVSTYITTENDAPGAGLSCITMTGEVAGVNAATDINISNYDAEDLSLAFWCYSDTDGEVNLATRAVARVSNNTGGTGSKFLQFNLGGEKVKKGWNYITIPFSEATNSNFEYTNIKTFALTGTQNFGSNLRYFTEFKLVVTKTVDWTLGNSTSMYPSGGTGVSTYITTENDAPGAGLTCITMTGDEVPGANVAVNIDISKYKAEDLTLAFWCYSNTDGEVNLASRGVARVSNNSGGTGSKFLQFNLGGEKVKKGWNYITIPFSEATDSSFTYTSIKTFALTGTQKFGSSIRYFTDFQLIAIEKVESTLGNQASLYPDAPVGVGTYTTVAGDALGAGLTCITMTGDNVAGTRAAVNIDISKYDAEDLALAFWCYSNNDGEVNLATRAVARVSNNSNGTGSKFLQFNLGGEKVKKGWNYITIPFSEATADNFEYTSIKTFALTGTQKFGSNIRYFSDFQLVLNEEVNEWTLGNQTSMYPSGGTGVGTYTTTGNDAPGAGLTCITMTGDEVPGANAAVNIDISKYKAEDLALAFWCYSNNDGEVNLASRGVARVSNNSGGTSSKFLQFNLGGEKVKKGWNYITIPFSEATADNFEYTSIKTFALTGTQKFGSNIRYFTDFKLVKMISVKDNVDANSLSNNNMIFSNTNVANETNPFALFVAPEGYPALLVGSKQFTLHQYVRTNEWVNLAVTINDDNTVSFYVNGKLQGTSSEKVADSLATPDTAHCIGADGSGGQIMNGTIADVRVWDDVRTADEIRDNLIEKTQGNLSNGMNNRTQGLLGSWMLIGDIQHVYETMEDTSKYENTAVYRGSRADDWIDYEIPDEIGDDYWSVVFIPDIQNLIRSAEYNMTWEKIVDWIVDNIEDENIQHVISAGDSTWNNVTSEYDRAMKGYNQFKNEISWNTLIGNHDYVWKVNGQSIDYRDSTLYQSYFGKNVINSSAASSTYVGSFDDPAGKTTTENSYYRFSVNNVKWMILQLEYQPRVSVMEWAQSILEQYPEDNVIITTHSYLNGNGNYSDNRYMTYTSKDNEIGGSIGNGTENMWREYLDTYTNVKLILCGHAHNGTGAVIERIETYEDGSGTVPALMINAQDLDYGEGTAYYTDQPLGMLGILRFSADGKNVALQYYSPTADKSFSPEDLNGKEDSNNLVYSFDVETCSHNGTTIEVNENAVTTITSGYTGDTYCYDCGLTLSKGTVISASGKRNPIDTDKNVSNETNKNSTENSPKTGDEANIAVWSSILVAAVVVFVLARKFRMQREGRGE